MMSNLWKEHLIRYVGIAIFAFAIIGFYALVALNLKVFSPIAKAIDDYSFEDFYYKILSTSEKSDTSRVVTIVDMTDLKNRRELADVVMRIDSMHPKVLGVDVYFKGLKEDTLGDSMMADAAKRCSNAVFAYELSDRTDDAYRSYFMSCDSLKEGFINMPRNLYGGLKRNLKIGRVHQGKLCPSFIKQVADSYAGVEVVELADKDLNINFSPIHFQVLKSSEIEKYPELIPDRVVLLGAIKDDEDMHYTPQGKMPGVELLAYGVETMLAQKDLHKVPGWLTCIISFLIVVIVAAIRSLYCSFAARQKVIARTLLSTVFMIGLVVFISVAVIVGIGFLLFTQYQISINLTYALAAIAFLYSATNFYETFKKLIHYKKSS